MDENVKLVENPEAVVDSKADLKAEEVSLEGEAKQDNRLSVRSEHNDQNF